MEDLTRIKNKGLSVTLFTIRLAFHLRQYDLQPACRPVSLSLPGFEASTKPSRTAAREELQNIVTVRLQGLSRKRRC